MVCRCPFEEVDPMLYWCTPVCLTSPLLPLSTLWPRTCPALTPSSLFSGNFQFWGSHLSKWLVSVLSSSVIFGGICMNHHTALVGMWYYTNDSVPNYLAPGVTLCTYSGATCGKYNIGKYNIFSHTWWSHVVWHGESLPELRKYSVFHNLNELSLI